MTTFLRLMTENDKAGSLLEVCASVRAGEAGGRAFQVAPESFRAVLGAPFVYWVRHEILSLFSSYRSLRDQGLIAWVGLQTNEDFRWVRLWWEASEKVAAGPDPVSFAKGGSYSPYYADVYLTVRWGSDGRWLKEWKLDQLRKGAVTANNSQCWNEGKYFRPGLTWPRRTNGLSFRAMPQGCIFADKGPAAFVADDAPDALLAHLALVNSQAFGLLVSLQLARTELAQSFEVGLIQRTPVPDLTADQRAVLATLARRAWSQKRTLDTVEETSHAFMLPAALRTRLGDYDPPAIEAELGRIQAEIDTMAFDFYGFAEADRAVAPAGTDSRSEGETTGEDEDDGEETATPVDDTAGLLSWAVGVSFGRFDLRLASGERAAPLEPEPFDPLPAKSPGMLPDGDPPFHENFGILVDDRGHRHDLAEAVDRVLDRVGVEVAGDRRAWLRREFFPLHLKQYSKSRRKAPIYWPLSAASGSYTLWLYYPALTDQTLFLAANDFIGVKLERQVEPELRALRASTGRSRDEERRLEELQVLDEELRDLRDELLRLAPTWKPNHDDGVQITAAPLWRLFRHGPWQKLLKETWEKLEKGDYDWAHLAMAYWPERVREKCRTDKSLAIAHDLEHLYEPPPEAPAKARGRKRKGGAA